MAKTPRIDVHSHVFPREMPISYVRARMIRHALRRDAGGERLLRDDGHVSPLFDEFFDADAKVEGMDARDRHFGDLADPMIYFYNLGATLRSGQRA